MATKGSSNQWFWLITRRTIVHLLLGMLLGALSGAFWVGAAGVIVGAIIDMAGPTSYLPEGLAPVGGVFGLAFGGVTGGVIGLLGWGVIGIIAPPSRVLWPSRTVVFSTLLSMAIASVLGLSCFFAWNLGFVIFGADFVRKTNDHVMIALFGVPAMMGVGQIIGIWRAAIKLKNSKTEL